jgi:Fe-S cluster biogenesis protein NfuA
MESRVLEVLEYVRPFLQEDGGDIEFVRWEEASGIVEVRLLGACTTCAMSALTLRAGVERALMHAIPEIRRIEAVWG